VPFAIMAPAGDATALAMGWLQDAGGSLSGDEEAADEGGELLLAVRPVTRGRFLGGRAKLLAMLVSAVALTCLSAQCLVGSRGAVASLGSLAGGGAAPAEASSASDIDAVVELSGTRRRRSSRRRQRLTINARRRRNFKGKLGETNKKLGQCDGDCNWKLVQNSHRYISMDDCPGRLKCFRHRTRPPGCSGKAEKDIGYCAKDPHAVLMIVSAKRSRTDFEIALSHHKTPRVVDMIAKSSGTMEYHLKNARTKGKAEFSYLRGLTGDYQYVVIQEYCRIPVYRSNRRRGAATQFKKSSAHLKALDTLVRKQGGKTVIFQSWGDRDNFDAEMPIIRKSIEIWQDHLTRRRRVHYSPKIAPMGDAYANIKKWSKKQFMGLFAKNNQYHETEAGRYLGAMVLYETVTGDSCVGLPGPVGTKFSKSKTKKFQLAAHHACQKVTRIR